MAGHSAADLRARIARRFGTRAQDDERGAVVVFEVPTGDMERRRADALVINYAPAAPPLVGIEIKLTRDDWLTELADPAKAEAWARYCHLWWVAAPPGVIQLHELPERWGLLEPQGKVLLLPAKEALPRRPEPLPPYRMVQIVRRVDAARAAEVRAARAPLLEELEAAKAALRAARDPLAVQTIEDARIFQNLLDAAGLTAHRWQISRDGLDSDAGKALIEAVGGLARVQRSHGQARHDAQGLLQALQRAAETLSKALDTGSGPGDDSPA